MGLIGVVSLYFAPETYRRIEGVCRAVTTGETRLSASTGSGGEVPLEVRLLPREREVLLAGGTLEHLRDGNRERGVTVDGDQQGR